MIKLEVSRSTRRKKFSQSQDFIFLFYVSLEPTHTNTNNVFLLLYRRFTEFRNKTFVRSGAAANKHS